MKTPKFLQRKKLHATARRVSPRVVDDYEQEPNMKLSSAFVVVLVLHIVAVGGMFAFDSIKANQQSKSFEPNETKVEVPVTKIESASVTPAVTQHGTDIITTRESRTITSVNSKEGFLETVHSGKKKAEVASAPVSKTAASDSGKFYVVEKGDNPVAIARKLEVSYDALLKLNNIDDPRRLQIGQKLKVPSKK